MMKQLTVFGMMMILLVSMASAIQLTLNPAAPYIAGENQDITITLTSDGPASFTQSLAGATLTSQSNTQATFTYSPGFDSDNVARTFQVTFTATNSSNVGDKATQTVTLQYNNVNRAPTAEAGAGRTVEANTSASLSGSGSDPDGDALTYSWTQKSGTALTITNANQADASFTPSALGTYVFTLTVSDGLVTDTDDVTMNVREPIKLAFSDIDIEVGSEDDNNLENKDDGYRIREEAKGGEKITIDVEVENLFTDDEDIEIQDVFMEVIIEGIDEDSDDLEDETDEEDIGADNDERFSLSFDIPRRVDEGDYDLIITVEGEDENGVTHRISKEFVLEVDKERHEIVIERAELRTSTLSCNRRTELDVVVLNLGSDEEEEVRITAESPVLGLDFEEFDDGDIELETGDDDDAEYSVDIPVDATGVLPGSYEIDVRVYRDETTLEDSDTVGLTVTECQQQPTTPPPTTPQQPDEEDDDDVVEVIDQPTTPPGQFPVVVEVDEPGFTQSPAYLALLAVAAVVLVALIIVIIVVAAKKRD